MPAVISVENLTVSYGASPALADVSFVVEPGDYVGLVGPNGSGKSTLVSAMLGILPAATGSVRLFGARPGDFSAWEKIGYMPQRIYSYNPIFPATVREVVALGLLGKKEYPKTINATDREAIREALDIMGIRDLADHPIADLSGGQQQKVFLARAIVAKPELLILDEPSAALDAQAEEAFFEVVERLNRERGTAVVLVSHDIGSVSVYANKLLYLDKRVAYFGPLADFPASRAAGSHFSDYLQHFLHHVARERSQAPTDATTHSH